MAAVLVLGFFENTLRPLLKSTNVDTDSYRELTDHHIVTLVVWLAGGLFLDSPSTAAEFCLFEQCEYEQQDRQVDTEPGQTIFGRHFTRPCLVLFLSPERNEPSVGHMKTAKFLRRLSPNLLNCTILKGL